MFLAAALWAGCGAAVFCILCARDNHSLQDLSSAAIAPHFATPIVRAASVPVRTARPLERNRFTLSQRARQLQKVGPVKLGIRRIDRKLRFCDLTLVIKGHRKIERRIAANEPVWIAVPGESGRLERLTITHISSKHVSGYVREDAIAEPLN